MNDIVPNGSSQVREKEEFYVDGELHERWTYSINGKIIQIIRYERNNGNMLVDVGGRTKITNRNGILGFIKRFI